MWIKIPNAVFSSELYQRYTMRPEIAAGCYFKLTGKYEIVGYRGQLEGVGCDPWEVLTAVASVTEAESILENIYLSLKSDADLDKKE